jgi:cobalt-zinc-cadmium efflux system outer membrane protein
MYKFILLLCSFACAGLAESGKLTLDRALDLSRNNSPRLKAAQMKTAAAEKSVSASGLWQNPKLKFSAEGVGGDLDGVSDTEYELGLVQTFQRGGKRALDRRVSGKAVDVAVQSHAEQELELFAEVRRAFIDVLSQQEIGEMRSEQEQLGRAFVEVAKTRYEAGGGSELDMVQAELALEEILLAQTCCFGDLEAARIRLASLVGMTEPEMEELEGSYYKLNEVGDCPPADSYPALRRLDAQVEMLRAEAARARASDSADITLGAGVKYEAAEDINTFVVSASIPLNFVRGGRAVGIAALANAEALAAEREEVRRVFQQQLSRLIALYRGAKMEAEMTAERLVPKALQAYEVSKAGYDAGRFSWLELINAQQHLTAIRVRNIEALRDAHFARAEITKFMKEEL